MTARITAVVLYQIDLQCSGVCFGVVEATNWDLTSYPALRLCGSQDPGDPDPWKGAYAASRIVSSR